MRVLLRRPANRFFPSIFLYKMQTRIFPKPSSEQEGKHKCDPCSSGCLECLSLEKCDNCKITWFPKDNGKCGKCPVDCKTCRSGDNCDVCMDGFYKDKKLGENEDLICKKCMVNCDKCFSKNSCESCSKGFKFNQKNATCSKSNLMFFIIASVVGLFVLIFAILVICCCFSGKGKKKRRSKKKSKETDSEYNSLGISDESSYVEKTKFDAEKSKVKVGIADRYKGSAGIYGKDDDAWEEY